MLTPCSAEPSTTARAAAMVAPVTSADASCMPGNTGSSAVPRPYRSASGVRPDSPARRPRAMYSGVRTSSRSASVAGVGAVTATPGAVSTPSERASRMVSSTRTGASGWPGPKSYSVSLSSQATYRLQVTDPSSLLHGTLAEQPAPLDQGKERPGGPLRGEFHGLGVRVRAVVEQQHGVAARGRLHGRGQGLGPCLVTVGQGPDGVQKRVVERLLGGLDLGMADLVQAGLVEPLEQRPVVRGETNVAAGHSGQPARGVGELGHLRQQRAGEYLERAHRNGRQQVFAVGEVGVGGADRDAEPAAGLAQGDLPHAALPDELDRGVDQRRPEVTVVVAAALARSRHGVSGYASRALSGAREI